MIVGFASQFFVAGILDPADMGRIKIMQTYINLSALICGLGFETSLLTLVSASGDEAEKRRLYQAALLVSMGSFALLFVVLSAVSYLGIISADPVITRLFPLYMLFLLPLTVQNLQMAYYQATKRIKTMARLQLIVKSVTVALLIYDPAGVAPVFFGTGERLHQVVQIVFKVQPAQPCTRCPGGGGGYRDDSISYWLRLFGQVRPVGLLLCVFGSGLDDQEFIRHQTDCDNGSWQV